MPKSIVNGTGDGGVPNNQNVIAIVVIAIAVNATIAVLALGWCMVTNTKPDSTLLTAYVGLAGTLSGYLGGMLSRTTPSSSVSNPAVQDVNMINPPSDPANVEMIQPKGKKK